MRAQAFEATPHDEDLTDYSESLLYFRNMPLRLDNRPLLGTIDRDLFLPPTIMPELKAAIDRKLNVLVLGPPGSGKTTLLRSLEADHENDEQPAIYVDLNPAQNATQALMIIADALSQRWSAFRETLARERTNAALLQDRLGQVGLIGDTLRSTLIPETTPSGALLRLARRLGDAPASLLLIDAPPGEGHAHTLFGRLRDELWQLGHQWVVAANDVLRDELTRPPASAFFDVQLDLAPLSTSEQREFLARRLAGEPGVRIDAIVDQTDGLPRSLLQLARTAAISTESVDDLIAERDKQRARLAKLPRLASTIAEYLADHGPASGSDPELLATLGVSGQRARQVLRKLEDEGFVRSFPERQERSGRPRKLYELRENYR